MSEKQPEEIMRQVLELEKELKRIKSRTERPIPVVRDRQGKLAKDLTLKEWLLKLNEEVDELKYEVMGGYYLNSFPGDDVDSLSDRQKFLIVEELCDVIEVLYSMAKQMGIDVDMIQQGIHYTNEKLKERGCI
jgi:hypothetical protein